MIREKENSKNVFFNISHTPCIFIYTIYIMGPVYTDGQSLIRKNTFCLRFRHVTFLINVLYKKDRHFQLKFSRESTFIFFITHREIKKKRFKDNGIIPMNTLIRYFYISADLHPDRI
ncbi:MAG: hypothetical protein CVV44_10030 [Spirochaetae bacterium HGW-Spirochaetae-1]|nr:MAG: hypothetical protein CVV44_10030 [Spirochaetae bacterium HGW-Spirochaetae-1]